MRFAAFLPWLLAVQLAGGAAIVRGQPDEAGTGGGPRRLPSEALATALEIPALRELVSEALERNPGVARARYRAAAAAALAPQVRPLPDPVAAVTLFVLPPETRVGPQELSASISQKLPWFGKLKAREQGALYAAAAAEARIEAVRLDVVAEAQRSFYELAFTEEHEAIVRAERAILERYEEVARARYSTGTGLQQEILRIQAQITRTDVRLLEVSERRASLLAAVNALRDRPAHDPVGGLVLPRPTEPDLDVERLRRGARSGRPEVAAAEAEIARWQTLIELAEKNYRPDFTASLSYTLVGRREDPAGRLSPPPDDGDDVLALTGAFHLPVRRRKLAAGLEEALAGLRGAGEEKRRLLAEIEGSVGDLAARLPLLYEHWKLLEGVLRIQAREALRSAEAAYTAGKLNAVDLLDAEVVLFDVRTAAARTLTDYAVARARLESATARPLSPRKDQGHDR